MRFRIDSDLPVKPLADYLETRIGAWEEGTAENDEAMASSDLVERKAAVENICQACETLIKLERTFYFPKLVSTSMLSETSKVRIDENLSTLQSAVDRMKQRLKNDTEFLDPQSLESVGDVIAEIRAHNEKWASPEIAREIHRAAPAVLKELRLKTEEAIKSERERLGKKK